MPCEIAIELQEDGEGPRITLTGCNGGRSFTSRLPNNAVVFNDPETSRGLEAGHDWSFSVHLDGTVEFNSPAVEYSTTVSEPLARRFYTALEGRAGNVLGDDIVVDDTATEAEDPSNVGGRKRRSRVKKQTRRAQRKRRNTKRR